MVDFIGLLINLECGSVCNLKKHIYYNTNAKLSYKSASMGINSSS